MPLGIVYVLTNPAMPGLIKIGRTSLEDARGRLGQLYSTGVPLPFTLEFACRVQNTEEVENALHQAFSPNRVNPRREFFSIEPQQAIAILKLLHTEEATEEIAKLADVSTPEEKSAEAAFIARRPPLNFLEMGIPVGSNLISTEDESIATVLGTRRVKYQDEEMSLTAATKVALGITYDLSPVPYWRFNGKSLRDIYNETYPLGGI